ncbi:MAG: 6-bladed beta-propeller [Thermodesulfovibrionales bacterium]|nr:6-bladed beta-propeller [Thermodesulfovibrionales bacterium]
MKFLKTAGCWFIFIALLASCAKIPVEKAPELCWPFPPEKPRIKFLDLIMGSIDVSGVRSGKLRQLLFGEEAEVGFGKPMFIAGRDGVIYITDVLVIHVYDFKRKRFSLIGGGLFTNATGIAVSADGRLFVGDSVKKKVLVIEPGGKSYPLEDPGYKFDTPGGIAIDNANGRVIIADAKNHNISVWSLEGRFLFSFGKRGTEFGDLNFPYAVAADKEGRIYVVDSGNFRIQIFDKDGNLLVAFGSVGMAGGQFARPKGIALDSEGHIYVIDASFGNFQIFDGEGNLYLAVGTNGAEPGKFSLPMGIYIDETDKIYVVDQINRRIQVFQYILYKDETAGEKASGGN